MVPSLYLFVFFFNDTATTEIYTLSLHDALPICCFVGRSSSKTHIDQVALILHRRVYALGDRKIGSSFRSLPEYTVAPQICTRSHSTRSEEHTSELQSLAYLVCRLLLEKKKKSNI